MTWLQPFALGLLLLLGAVSAYLAAADALTPPVATALAVPALTVGFVLLAIASVNLMRRQNRRARKRYRG